MGGPARTWAARLAAVVACAAAGVPASAVPLADRVPAWLPRAERSLLQVKFGGARPVDRDYVPYRRKIAVVWTFDAPVYCQTCHGPPGSRVGGRVIRVGF